MKAFRLLTENATYISGKGPNNSNNYIKNKIKTEAIETIL